MKDRDRAVAFHEAGHAVIAHALDLPVVTVTIDPGEHTEGSVALELGGNPTDETLSKHVLCTHAGAMAQRRGAPRTYHPAQALSDHATICDLCLRIAGNEDELARLPRELENEARDLVHEWWTTIETVAAELLARRTLSGVELAAVVNTRSD